MSELQPEQPLVLDSGAELVIQPENLEAVWAELGRLATELYKDLHVSAAMNRHETRESPARIARTRKMTDNIVRTKAIHDVLGMLIPRSDGERWSDHMPGLSIRLVKPDPET